MAYSLVWHFGKETPSFMVLPCFGKYIPAIFDMGASKKVERAELETRTRA